MVLEIETGQKSWQYHHCCRVANAPALWAGVEIRFHMQRLSGSGRLMANRQLRRRAGNHHLHL